MEPAVAFGRALRKRRLGASMTQEKLALEAGLERVYISWIETGNKQPTFRTMVKLASALGCSASALVGDAEALMSTDDNDESESKAEC